MAGRRLVAVDGTCLDVADTAANAEYFGRPGVNKGEQAAFPQARVVALAECGTHAVFAAEVGTYSESETTLAETLLDRLKPGMLLTADRGFFSYALWRKAIATGADLLWRVRTDKAGPKPTHVEDLPDGSWLAHLRGLPPPRQRRQEPMLVRVIDYTIDDGRDNPDDLPPVHHAARPDAGQRAGPRRRLHPALGDRTGLRRTQDPPTRATHRTALEVARPGPPGDLGPPVLPLRDPLPDGRGGHPRRARPGPRQLRRRPTDHPPDPRPPGRLFPLTSTAATAPLARLPPPTAPPAQPHPASTLSAPRHQTQVRQMARQTRPPRQLAATRRHHQPTPSPP